MSESTNSDNPTTSTPNAPAPPPAATTVNDGSVTEETTELRKALEAERAARKKAETDAAYAQDEARRLKEAQMAAAQQARPAAQKPKSRGWTLLHDEED